MLATRAVRGMRVSLPNGHWRCVGGWLKLVGGIQSMRHLVLRLFVRLWLLLGWRSRAAQLLAAHLDTSQDVALHWQYLALSETLALPLATRLHAYRRAVQVDSTSPRAAAAWRRIGQLEELRGEGIAAVAAYQEAERLGSIVPELERFTHGDWEAIPGFARHPDFPFPVVCSVDLEVAPRPNLPLAERVFEVGLVRFRGHTHLASYMTTIQRPWCPSAATDQPAPVVCEAVTAFLGTAWLTGHNLRGFDAAYLRALNVPIAAERILDTLEVAHLLAPESPRHDLATLCAHFGIPLTQWHQAVHDATAAAHLCIALARALASQSHPFVIGLRALVPPGSAFDRILLQPHSLSADPALAWDLDPAPAPPHLLPARTGNPPSPAMQQALAQYGDLLVEREDADGTYAATLPPGGPRTLILVGTRARADRMLAAAAPGALVLIPDPATLLCPDRVCAAILAAADPWLRVELFCAYQASHLHDAARLWAWRHGSPRLRAALAAACCAVASDTPHCCAGQTALHTALATAPALLATHRVFFALSTPPPAAQIIIDDASLLPARLPEFLTDRLRGEALTSLADPVA
jgi:hypothetical protein